MAETLSTEFLTKQMGPLPTWGWALLGVGGAVLISKFRTSKTATPPTGTTTTPVTTPTSLAGVPDFISQTYINFPGRPRITPPGTPGPTQTPPGPTPTPTPTPTPSPSPTPPASTPNPTPTPTPAPAPQDNRTADEKWNDWTDPITYTVQSGDTLSGIAAKYGLSWWDLWWYNTQTSLRPASTRQTIINRGSNTAGFAGSTWLIPAKGKIAQGGHS